MNCVVWFRDRTWFLGHSSVCGHGDLVPCSTDSLVHRNEPDGFGNITIAVGVELIGPSVGRSASNLRHYTRGLATTYKWVCSNILISLRSEAGCPAVCSLHCRQ